MKYVFLMMVVIIAGTIAPGTAINEKYINETDELVNFVYDNHWSGSDAPAFACCIVLMEIRDILTNLLVIESDRLMLQKIEIAYTRVASRNGYNSLISADETARSTPNEIYS